MRVQRYRGVPDAGSRPHAIGDVVLNDNEILALLVLVPNDDMAVWMADVEMADRDPIELGSKVSRHLEHSVPGKGV